MAYAFRNHFEYRKTCGGHCEDLDHVPEFKEKVDSLIDNAKEILFVGWRYDADSAYDHFDYTCKFANVCLVEAWKANCDAFAEHNRWNHPVEVINADILEFIKQTDRKWDVCAWFDGPEHVTQDQFVEFLRSAYGKIGTLIISTPNGVFPQGAIGGNKYEIHQSTWYEETFQNFGFETTKWLPAKQDSPVKDRGLMGFKKMTWDEPNIVELGIFKPKLYVYPHARIQSQDRLGDYFDTTPMSIEGVAKHFKTVTNPDEADFFHMGMISCGTAHEFTKESFTYLDAHPDKHIVDLEGDWVSNVAPPWVAERIKSGNSSKPEHLVGPLCVRPAISNLLLYLAKVNPEYELEFPDINTFCFRGFPDPFGVRQAVVGIMTTLGLPGEYGLTNQFNARKTVTDNAVSDYISLLHRHLLSVCPRGAGIDSIRFYETCFFGRVPICISDAKWLGEEDYDMSFAYRISPSLPHVEIGKQLVAIQQTPNKELIEKAAKARDYFQKVVMEYFKDPTLYFLKYLKVKKIL